MAAPSLDDRYAHRAGRTDKGRADRAKTRFLLCRLPIWRNKTGAAASPAPPPGGLHRRSALNSQEAAMPPIAWTWAALMPHPPVILPEVGKGREKEAALTLDGAERLRALLAGRNRHDAPDVLYALSPHQPYAPGALFLNTAPVARGTLARFGAPGASVLLETHGEALEELKKLLKQEGIPIVERAVADITPDHGSMVPLLGIAASFPGGRLPPVILGNPAGLSPERAFALGVALRGLSSGYRRALLASGDLSHRLKADGPYGFNPAGPEFDNAVVEALTTGNPAPLTALTPDFCDDAGECGMRSVLVLLGLAQGPVQVLSYEGPFGVGYCNALWTPDEQKTDARAPTAPAPDYGKTGHPYPRLARKTIAARLAGAPLPGPDDVAALSADASLWSTRHGCFVSIKNKDGSLRGCIGTFLPAYASLDAEIIANAVSAAFRDPRFPPLRADELDSVRLSVDILSQPELVTGVMELDPVRYGVIVTKGERRGLLLPDLEGVDSVEKQLAIAASKAGITNREGADIYRFTVDRFNERGGPEGGL